MTHKITIKISLMLAFFAMILVSQLGNAQGITPYVNGVIHDEFGKPLAEVVVSSDNGKNRAFSNEHGEYSLLINDGSKSITFSCIGYANKKMVIGENKEINVNLKSDQNLGNEIIQLGYSTQRRSEITGAISTVSGEELKKSPVANLSMTFAGRLAGLSTKETSSELSRASTDLNVRGICANRASDPLVIIDGIPTSYNSAQSLEYISPSEIESVTVLKDASTEALYGIQGANGIIVITTKRGRSGQLKVNVRMDESIQQVTTKPTFINSSTYATLRNEAANNDGKTPFYTDDQIANYKSGTNRDLYPNTNWYDLYMKKFTQMQRVGVDLSGGNDWVRYFTDVNMMHQGSQFKVDHPAYDSNLNFTWVDFRSNVDMKINQYLSAYVNLAGNVKREKCPGNGTFSNTIYSSLFYMPSTIYGPVTPSYIDSSTGNPAGNQVVTTNSVSDPTYGILNRSGFTKHTVTNIYAHCGLNLDMNFLTEGLSASGEFAYQTNSVGHLNTTQDYERYVRTSDPDTLAFGTPKGKNTNSTLDYAKSTSYYYYLTYKSMLNYKKDIGLNHITGMAYMFYQNLTKTDTSSPGCLPYNRLSSGAEATYDYDQKYLLKLDMGYSGSEQFARGHRYTATPAVSVGWVASRENFMSNIDWINNLKLRASYGRTANDQCGLSRFAYLDNVTWGDGGRIGSLTYLVTENQTGNPNIEAEVVKKQNYGIDLGLFNQLSLSIDVFREKMDNMVVNASSNVVSYQGIPLGNYPSTNAGKFKNKGYDIALQYVKPINKDLTISLGGFVSYAKNTVIYSGEAEKTDDYTYRKWSEGYSYGQSWGYLVDNSNGNGFFNSNDEITKNKLDYTTLGTLRVGDLKYKDLNGDGIIDEKDKAPLGTGNLPLYYYGFSGGFTYKSFDISVLFQGVAEYKTIESGIGVYDTSYDGVFGSLHLNAYTTERYNSGAKITAPALSTTSSTSDQPSNYYLYNRAYLRLKNVEIGYTLPDHVAKLIAASKVRFTLSGQNLFTWDHMKSNDYGPEGNYSSVPVYRVYSVGLSLQF